MLNKISIEYRTNYYFQPSRFLKNEIDSFYNTFLSKNLDQEIFIFTVLFDDITEEFYQMMLPSECMVEIIFPVVYNKRKGTAIFTISKEKVMCEFYFDPEFIFMEYCYLDKQYVLKFDSTSRIFLKEDIILLFSILESLFLLIVTWVKNDFNFNLLYNLFSKLNASEISIIEDQCEIISIRDYLIESYHDFGDVKLIIDYYDPKITLAVEEEIGKKIETIFKVSIIYPLTISKKIAKTNKSEIYEKLSNKVKKNLRKLKQFKYDLVNYLSNLSSRGEKDDKKN